MGGRGRLQVRILGCGSSGGVPRIGNDWGVCDPAEPRNRRSRCSILLRWSGAGATDQTMVLVDTSPDMRDQLLAANVQRLDAVLMTHDHADQSHGLDDLRALVLRAYKRIPVHMDEPTASTLGVRFGYCFEGAGSYPAILDKHVDIRPGQVMEVVCSVFFMRVTGMSRYRMRSCRRAGASQACIPRTRGRPGPRPRRFMTGQTMTATRALPSCATGDCC